MIVLFEMLALAQEPGVTVDHVAQARFFLKKGWTNDAALELERAVATPEGSVSAEAWLLLARTRLELCDIEAARDALSHAQLLGVSDALRDEIATLSSFVRDQFGVVEIRSAHDGLAGTLSIELRGFLIDPELKRYLTRLKDRLPEKTVLPMRIGLPAGQYSINGHNIDLGGASVVPLLLPPADFTAKGGVVQLMQAELGLGMGVWFGESVEHLHPAFSTELAVVHPLGPLVGGAVANLTPQTYTTEQGTFRSSSDGFSVGGFVGFDVPGLDPIVIRPSLGYRFAHVPGIELNCTAGSDDTWTCGQKDDADLVIYAVGRAHILVYGLSVDTLDRRRKNGFGIGVKVYGERAFGRFAREADAQLTTAGTPVVYSIEPDARTWSAVGLRFLFNASVAF